MVRPRKLATMRSGAFVSQKREFELPLTPSRPPLSRRIRHYSHRRCRRFLNRNEVTMPLLLVHMSFLSLLRLLRVVTVSCCLSFSCCSSTIKAQFVFSSSGCKVSPPAHPRSEECHSGAMMPSFPSEERQECGQTANRAKRYRAKRITST